ncbi:MAG: hypothetical protein EOP62_00620 [Sphingomonadales bacterium]|nr:MAG: hypothetical protein EOP62_00620 [Sphingomonadales bacterium]
MDIDTALERLRTEPAHPGLSALDPMHVANEAQEVRRGRATLAAVGGIALCIGVAGALPPAQPAQATPLVAMGDARALAPSTVLDASR